MNDFRVSWFSISVTACVRVCERERDFVVGDRRMRALLLRIIFIVQLVITGFCLFQVVLQFVCFNCCR